MPIPNKQCETCNKSTLSLLLLRPSPIAKRGALVPPGSAAVASDEIAMAGLLPERLPTESRFALRLLRDGYVHVYIASPPPGVKNWLVYRVTDTADLVPDWHPSFKKPVACKDDKHNQAGMKLLNIPQAHKINELWIAYSANLWNATLRAKNQANSKAMKHVSLDCRSANTFQPTTENLKSKVLECALGKLRVNGGTDHEFPFHSIAQRVEDLADNLKKAAACHPKTKGKELAVVLADPVGIASELNALRLRRHELVKDELAKPEIAHPFKSSNALMGLKKIMLDANHLKSYETVSPVMNRGEFENVMRVKPNPRNWPADTRWEPIEPTRENIARFGSGMGNVIFPEHEERAYAWAERQTRATWSRMEEKYDETARLDWHAKFEADMKAKHYDPLEKYELDWLAACDDAATLTYFKLHFDPEDPDDPRRHHSPGTVYAAENNQIHRPQPMTKGAALPQYLARFEKPFSDEAAIAWRALVGNQKSLFEIAQQQLNGNPNDTDEKSAGMRDKTVDFVKELLTQNTSQTFQRRYGWLADAVCAFSAGQVASFSAAAVAAIAGSTSAMARSSMVSKWARKAERAWLLQQCPERALQATQDGRFTAPVLLKQRLPIAEALEILRARSGQNLGSSRSQLKREQRVNQNATVELTLLTDSETLRAAGGDVDSVIRNPATGTVALKQAATAAEAAVGRNTVVASRKVFDNLYMAQAALAQQAANSARDALAAGGKAMTMSLDGRLALGIMVVQSVGLYFGILAVNKPQDQKELKMAWWGLYDSAAGLLGGTMYMARVGVEAMTAAKAGANAGEAVAKSVAINVLKVGVELTGVAGGVLSSMSSYVKAKEAREAGDHRLEFLYLNAAGAFFGTAVTSGALGAGVAAEFIVAREIGGRAVRRVATGVATRMATQVTVSALGSTAALTVTSIISGVGVVLLGAGIVFSVWAAVVEPTAMQKWAARSYFGKGAKKFPIGRWTEEEQALMEALCLAVKPPATQETPSGQLSDVRAA